MPARSTMTKGPLPRRLAAWMPSAHSSLPVPVSPWTSTSASPEASRSSTVKASRIFRLPPTSAPNWLREEGGMTRSRESSGTIFSSVMPSLSTAPGRTSSSVKRMPSQNEPLREPMSRASTPSSPHLQREVLPGDGAILQDEVTRGGRAQQEAPGDERVALPRIRPRQEHQLDPHRALPFDWYAGGLELLRVRIMILFVGSHGREP